MADPTNTEIADALDELGDLYELDGAVIHRVLAYRNAAKAVRDASVSVTALARESRATELPGVGAIIQEKVLALADDGAIPAAEKLRAKFPPGLLELTRLSGLGIHAGAPRCPPATLSERDTSAGANARVGLFPGDDSAAGTRLHALALDISTCARFMGMLYWRAASPLSATSARHQYNGMMTSVAVRDHTAAAVHCIMHESEKVHRRSPRSTPHITLHGLQWCHSHLANPLPRGFPASSWSGTRLSISDARPVSTTMVS